VRFLGLNLAFECSDFGFQFTNVVHRRLVFLGLVDFGLNLGNLFLDCRQNIPSRAFRPTLWVGHGFFNPFTKMGLCEH